MYERDRAALRRELARTGEVNSRFPAEGKRYQPDRHRPMPIVVTATVLNRPQRAARGPLRRVADWRARSYLRDQAFRVGLLAVLALGGLAAFAGIVWLIVASLVGLISSYIGLAGVALILGGLGYLSKSKPKAPHGHTGYGFHYTQCDHK